MFRGEELPMWADLVLVNANILTMNPNQPSAKAIAIKENRIISVGTNDEMENYIGKDTKIISLKGKTVVPGFIDTHIHVCRLWHIINLD